MKIMVLSDGETFTSIQGCQIVEVDDILNIDETEECLSRLNRNNETLDNAKILGGFDSDGNFIVGDPRTTDPKKKIILE